jgi:hypothetical protein
MEEEDYIIAKWAQEDVETLYSLLNKLYIYIKVVGSISQNNISGRRGNAYQNCLSHATMTVPLKRLSE